MWRRFPSLSLSTRRTKRNYTYLGGPGIERSCGRRVFRKCTSFGLRVSKYLDGLFIRLGLGSHRVYMDSFGFPDATLFDYLNPWSDLRIALDDILPHMLKAMKQEIQVCTTTVSVRKGGLEMTNCELEDAKICSRCRTEATRLRTPNILDPDVLAAIRPETLVVGKVNEGSLKGSETRLHCHCYTEPKR